MTTAPNGKLRRPFVFIIGPVPPPIRGAAATTKAIADYIAVQAECHVTGLTRGLRARLQGGIFGHLEKAWQIMGGIVGLLARAGGTPRRTLYMAVDGGLGKIYNIAIAAIARLTGYRIFLHYHSFAYVDRRSRLMAALTRVAGPSATHIVLCEAMADGLRDHYTAARRQRMIEVSSAAFVTPQDAARPIVPGPLRLGFLSNLIVEKGLDTSIELLRAARAEGLNVILMLAGKVPDERARAIVDAALQEFGPAISYLGPLTDDEKTAFFHEIDVFAFPSRYVNEAQPLAVLEAMSFGVPVLTIARSCITCDVGELGGLCAPADGDFVAAALPFVALWCKEPARLGQDSDAALSQARKLYAAGRDHLETMRNAMTAR